MMPSLFRWRYSASANGTDPRRQQREGLANAARRVLLAVLAVLAVLFMAGLFATHRHGARRGRGALTSFALQNVAARYRTLFPVPRTRQSCT